MKKWKILIILGSFLFLTGCGKTILSEEKTYENITYQETNKKTNTVVINLEQEKKIIMELYPDVAPITVANFQKLVASDFYNDTIFHRVVRNFVIQGGDGTDLGRNASTIKGEFQENGVENSLKHERGIVSMARNGISMDSASSQFFIVLENNQNTANLDGSYAAFGKVLAGMDVVDEIASVVTDNNDKPLKDIKMVSMEFIKVVDKHE